MFVSWPFCQAYDWHLLGSRRSTSHQQMRKHTTTTDAVNSREFRNWQWKNMKEYALSSGCTLTHYSTHTHREIHSNHSCPLGQPAKDSRCIKTPILFLPSASFNPSHPSMCSSPSCKWFTTVYHLLPRNAHEGEAKDQCSVCKPATEWLMLGTSKSAPWYDIFKYHSIPFGQKVSLPAAAAKSTAPLRMDLSTTRIAWSSGSTASLSQYSQCMFWLAPKFKSCPAPIGIDNHDYGVLKKGLRYVRLIMPIPAKSSFKRESQKKSGYLPISKRFKTKEIRVQ